MQYVHAHEPALMPQEAAMLTALPANTGRLMRRSSMLRPQQAEHFRSVSLDAAPAALPAETPRRGSVAGRAVLSAAGISLPGVQGMSRGCRRMQERQATAERPCASAQPVQAACCAPRTISVLELL